MRVPRLIQSAPAPFGPLNLCAESDSRSTPSARTSTGILPADCTASVCISAPRSCAIARELGDRLNRADLVVGVHHRDERRVVGDGLARRGPATTTPDWSTGTQRRRQPRRASAFSVLSTASCSMALATRWRRPVGSSASAAPRIAKLSGFGAAAGEDDLGRIGVDERGHRRSRLVERRLGLLAEVVHARRVAEDDPGWRGRRRRATSGARGVVAL